MATKNATIWGVRGHPRSSATSLFDRAYMTSYSTLIETMRLSCTVYELQRIFCQKWPILTNPTCICCPRSGWSHSNFAMIFDQKTKSPGAIVQHYLRNPTFSRFDTGV